MGGISVVFRQIIARGNVAWRCVWRGCRRSMETKRFHRARQYALECARAAIAMSDELHEQTRKIQARTIIARTIPVRTKRYSMLKHLTFARDPNYFLYYIASERRLLSSGANEVSGVLSEASCCRCGAPLIKKKMPSL